MIHCQLYKKIQKWYFPSNNVTFKTSSRKWWQFDKASLSLTVLIIPFQGLVPRLTPMRTSFFVRSIASQTANVGQSGNAAPPVVAAHVVNWSHLKVKQWLYRTGYRYSLPHKWRVTQVSCIKNGYHWTAPSSKASREVTCPLQYNSSKDMVKCVIQSHNIHTYGSGFKYEVG